VETLTTPHYRAVAKSFIESIATRDGKTTNYLSPNTYIQHNILAVDGVEGFELWLKYLPKGSEKARVVRAFEDGDFAFTHSEFNFYGHQIGFDIFRFEDGKIVEHWDNMQAVAGPNASGHTMMDGPTQPSDFFKTDTNKALVRSFIEDVLINEQWDQIANYIDGEKYIQHNPHVADGLSGLSEAMHAWASQGIRMKYEKLHMVLGQGNFVLAVSEGTLAGKHTSFYDLFRIENGLLAEHWDVIEEIPTNDSWNNENGKF